jgi:DNA-binding transcriptional MerR regulator
MGERMHQIGHVAATVGLSLRTVRYYEEVGLVPPSGRTEGGFRLYTDEDIERLELVKQLKPLEFTLEELRELMDSRDRLLDDATPARERELLRERMEGYVALAKERCKRLREQLSAVESVTRRLERETQAATPAS